MSVAENVRARREARGLTQQALADLLSVGRSYVAQIERGSKVPSMYMGKAIAEALGCSVEDLLKEREV
ncbi:MAG: helix-turn-helix transcriptional regulator [Clostridia bacterium]|nr:helix-turn-helix transcriptional regulator [Clostridia bacterium]